MPTVRVQVIPQVVGIVGAGEANEDVCGRFARPPEPVAPITPLAARDSSLLSEDARCGAMPRPAERFFIGEPDEVAEALIGRFEGGSRPLSLSVADAEAMHDGFKGVFAGTMPIRCM